MITRVLILGVVFLCSLNGMSQETYINARYGFKIEFPDLFTDDEKEKEDMTVISISSSYQKMIFLASIFDYKNEVPSDELKLKEIEALAATADAFNAKFKAKKIKKWRIGDYEGLSYPIKGKVKRQQKTMKFYGQMYVISIKKGLEFRLTVLAPSKKLYSETAAKDYINSAKID